MKLIYLDEAGNTGSKADPDQPIHMIGSLIVDEAHVRPIEIRLDAITLTLNKAIFAFEKFGRLWPL